MANSNDKEHKSIGVWVRDKLVDAGNDGVVVADLFKELRENHVELGLGYRNGTYHSFQRFFHWFRQLGWVEATGKTELAYQRGGEYQFQSSSRTFYRITRRGLSVKRSSWLDPIGAATDGKWSSEKRRLKYKIPSERPRGRPRKKVVVELEQVVE